MWHFNLELIMNNKIDNLFINFQYLYVKHL